jgi:hypothetical protein
VGPLELGARALPPVAWRAATDPKTWPKFVYAETTVESAPNIHEQRVGETLWIAQTEAGLIATAWQWTEMSPGVVLLSNPNEIASNLALLDEHRQRLDLPDAARAINAIVHSLAWQAPVCDVLASVARR